MHAVLRLQVAVGKLPTFYLHRHALDAGIVAIEDVGNRHLVAVSLGPSLIHAHEHLCPVLCLGATGTAVDFQHGIHRVFLLAEHVLQFEALDGLDGAGIVIVDLLFRHHLVLIEVESQLQLVGQGSHLLIAVEPHLDAFHLFHLFLGPLAVIPEVRGLRSEVFLLVFHLLSVDVEVAVECIGPLHDILQLVLCDHNFFIN